MGRDRTDVARPRRHARGRRRSRRSRGSSSTACPDTMPLRRSVAGHLTREQRLRRLVEDVLVGAGFSEAYTWSLVAARPGPGRAAPARADERRPGRAAHDACSSGLVEAARVNVDAGNDGDRALRARARLPPDRRAAARGALARRRDRRGGFAAARSAVETLYEALHLPFEPRRDDARRSSTPARRPRRTRAGSASSTRRCSTAPGACSSSTSPTLVAPVPERILYDDVITLPRQPPGHRGRRRRGRRGGGDRRGCARGGRARSCARRACSTSTAASRSGRVASRSRSTSSSSRPSGRSPTTRRPSLRERIVAALAERFGAELRA